MSSKVTPMVPPAPAVFSMSTFTWDEPTSLSARAKARLTRSRPAAKPSPPCEPVWLTMASAPSCSAAATAPTSEVTDFS